MFDRASNRELLETVRSFDAAELLVAVEGSSWLKDPDPGTVADALHRAAQAGYVALQRHGLALPPTVPPSEAFLRSIARSIALGAHSLGDADLFHAMPDQAGAARGAIGRARARRARRRA